jgi:hypothetical protein
MNVKQLVEGELAGETETIEEDPLQCYCFQHKSHMTLPGIEPGPSGWEGVY